jgi:heme exporter protein A
MNKKSAHLHVNNLTCKRGAQILFSDLSFELKDSEMLLIEGANGSGKSSLLRLLTGLASACAGVIKWQGREIQMIRDEYTSALHYLGHTNGMRSGLTIEENLQLSSHLSLSASIVINDTLKSLQLDQHKNTYIKHLSAGQKRRAALAKIFLLPKKIWILDEPLTALDASAQTFFLAALEQHLQNGGMAIISSHHPLTFQHAAIKHLRLASC